MRVLALGVPEALRHSLTSAEVITACLTLPPSEVDGNLSDALLTGGTLDVVLVGTEADPVILLETVRLARRLRPDTPVLAIVSDPWGETGRAMIKAGAQEVIPPSPEVLARLPRIAERARARLEVIRRLEMESLTDPLTGLLNRRGFFLQGEQIRKRAQRSRSNFVVILLDVDRLKSINDKYGHSAGDRALQIVGRGLQQALRSSDVCARIGGDEFAAVAADAEADAAAGMVERIREQIRILAAEHAEIQSEDRAWIGTLSVSAGWSECLHGTAISLAALVDAADVQVYAEKVARDNTRVISTKEDNCP